MARWRGLSCQHLTQIAQEACAAAFRAEGAGLLLRPVDHDLWNGSGLAGRPGDEGLSLHGSVPGPSSPHDGGFFCGVREGMFREEAGGSGGAPLHPLRASGPAGFCGT